MRRVEGGVKLWSSSPMGNDDGENIKQMSFSREYIMVIHLGEESLLLSRSSLLGGLAGLGPGGEPHGWVF